MEDRRALMFGAILSDGLMSLGKRIGKPVHSLDFCRIQLLGWRCLSSAFSAPVAFAPPIAPAPASSPATAAIPTICPTNSGML